MNFKNIDLLKITLFVFLVFVISCAKNDDTTPTDEPVANEEDEKDDEELNLTCDTSFPNLGPNTFPQPCSDTSGAFNIGTLDCRSSESYGGYANVSGGWGSYKITGGTDVRYNGTKARVERFFNRVNRSPNKKTVLTGTFRIYDLSDGNTCIVQSHAGGDILEGVEKGQTNRSAQFLLYAKKSGNNIALDIHVTTNPYTQTTGGSRTITFFRTLNYGEEYTFKYESGYDAQNKAFSLIKVGETEEYISHNHTTERVYSRYGAYGTSDTGDVTAHVQFKDIDHCRN